jgi:hypothetical protein
MRFVNLTSRYVFNSFTGNIAPGAMSSDGGKYKRRLEEVLSEVVKACGSSLGIRLNENEAALLNKLIDLDEKGTKFDPTSIPEEIRRDPTGARRVSEDNGRAQQAELDKIADANRKTARREAEINGEILVRKPAGPAAMKGEAVTVADL